MTSRRIGDQEIIQLIKGRENQEENHPLGKEVVKLVQHGNGINSLRLHWNILRNGRSFSYRHSTLPVMEGYGCEETVVSG